MSNEHGTRGRNIFMIDPRQIRVKEGFNPRCDFETGKEDLENDIRVNQVHTPLRVQSTQNGIYLLDGERRLRTVMSLISKGHDIKAVPCFKERETMNEGDALVLAYSCNNSKPFLPIEEAGLFRRLLNFGWTLKEVSTKTGRSETHINNRMLLLDAVPELKDMVDKKEIGTSLAQDIVKNAAGSAEAQKEMASKVASGKTGKKEVQQKIEAAKPLRKRNPDPVTEETPKKEESISPPASEKKAPRNDSKKEIVYSDLLDTLTAEKTHFLTLSKNPKTNFEDLAVSYGRVTMIAEIVNDDISVIDELFENISDKQGVNSAN